ncbi:MAG: D-alanyl-D-alanine carboxypeptidase/D-alanyl-D-alanine-endopeptidase [Bacteroidales bacterium]|nr:D-alanyl-D-alanine carboxypeptidase/D-alanyl-D-alanine-endopeptidase [Bacteroidales bacterium]
MKQILFFLHILLLLTACAGSRGALHTPENTPSSPPAIVLKDVPASLPLLPETAQAINSPSALAARLDSLCSDSIFGRTQLGLAVYDLTDNRYLYRRGERQCLRPASTMKVVTAIAALHTLGTGYHYSTRLLRTDGEVAQGDSIVRGNIEIKAGFDPLLSKDDLQTLVAALAAEGVRRIEGDIVADVSLKDTLAKGWGWCWDDDDAPLDALTMGGKDIFETSFRQLLADNGIVCSGTFRKGRLKPGGRTVASVERTIDEVLLPMMKKSDNLAAESMFYQIAAHSGKPYAGRREAVRAIEALVKKMGLNPAHYQFADGSGLSLYNYVTPELLVRLLAFAYNDEALRRHLLPALPIAGEDGTLARRLRGTKAQGNVRAKTGTVEGVSTLAGYCTAPNGHTLCFAIMNQGIRRTATGRNFQDRVCRALTE